MDHPGEVTKRWREGQKMSILALARLSGIDKGTISRFERCNDFEMRVFRSICEAFGKTLGDAYAEMATPKPAPLQASDILCSDPDHRKYQIKLDEILHKNAAKAGYIMGNVDTFHECLFPESTGSTPTPEPDHPPFGFQGGVVAAGKKKLKEIVG
jgi:transcriptional regulator with XRE-family HTH domain